MIVVDVKIRTRFVVGLRVRIAFSRSHAFREEEEEENHEGMYIFIGIRTPFPPSSSPNLGQLAIGTLSSY